MGKLKPERYALKVYYNGRDFSGSQRQPGLRTVEGELLASLKRRGVDFEMFKTAGRTDRGVSALGNVFALTTDFSPMEPRALNAGLPKDIRVLAMKQVEIDFNPRHALERTYRYFLFDTGYDVEKMKKAAASFVGQKSFHNFSSTDYRSPIRKINYVDVVREGSVLMLTFSGESFLWQMIRRMVTALKRVGKGNLEPSGLEIYFEPNYKMEVLPADAEHLVLWDVRYDFSFKHEPYSLNRFVKGLEKKQTMLITETAAYSKMLEGLS